MLLELHLAQLVCQLLDPLGEPQVQFALILESILNAPKFPLADFRNDVHRSLRKSASKMVSSIRLK